MLKEYWPLIYELSNISMGTLLHICGASNVDSQPSIERGPWARERKDFLLRLYVRAHPRKMKIRHVVVWHIQKYWKGGSGNIRKTFKHTNDANLFSSPLPPPPPLSHSRLLLFFSCSLRAKAQIILGASCCNTLIQSQESRLLRQNRSLISTLRPCDSAMKIERGTYMFAKGIESPRSIVAYCGNLSRNLSRVILFSLLIYYL